MDRGRLLAGLGIVAVLALAGCGGNEDDSAAPDTGTDAGANAESGTEGVPEAGPPDPNLTVEEVAQELPIPEGLTGDEQFDTDLSNLIAASHKVYSEALDSIDVEFTQPDELINYDGAGGDPGPDCGGEPAGPENAAYCRIPAESEHGIIAWDETGLLKPMYDELGDGSTAFIIGHEYAHLVQDRLGLIAEFPLTVEKELNADCWTGGLWGSFQEVGIQFTAADIDSIFAGISVVGDAPGTPWQDEHAHGNAQERQAAFTDGFNGGFRACIDNYAPGFSGG
jgi:hypothetical protein